MNKKKLTLGSLFDGSGGFPLGGILNGIEPKWASEVEPFPIMVTKKRIPNMKHLGDISTINGAEIEPVDIITCGSPCQDMSVAGKRNGLDGERSCLFYEAVRIIKEMRCKTNGKYPRFVVWENVPGAFSSNKGADFKAVLESICKIKSETFDVPKPEKWSNAGYIVAEDFSLAWRVLDAQHWGVPQRRKRIYLVADFADECAGKILFESEGLSGDTQKGIGSWERFASTFKNCIGKTSYGIDGYNGSIDEVISTLGVNCGISTGRNGVIVLNDQGGNRMDITNDKTTTLRAEAHHPPCVLELAGFCTEHSAKSRGIGFEEEKSPTLRAGVVPAAVYENHSQDCRYKGPLDVAQTVSANYGMGGNNQPFVVETPKTLKVRCGCKGGGKGALIQDNKSATLSCNNDQTVFVPFVKGTRPHSAEEGQQWKESNVANTLNTHDVGEARCNELAVKVYGICSKDSNAMKSDNPKSGFYEAETSRTVDTGGINPSCNQGGMAVVCTDKGCEPVIAVQGSVIGRKEDNGPNGSGISEDVSFTLNTVDRHAIAYGIDRGAFNSGEKAKFGFSVEEEKQPTMVSRGPGAVAVPSYSMTTGCFMQVNEEKAPTIAARDYKDPTLVGFSQESFNNYSENDHSACVIASGGNYGGGSETLVTDEVTYIVRRLTPTECALLQGFSSWWCSDLSIEEPTEEEIEWWAEVFETHRKIMGKSTKPKTRNQIIKWLKNPHSDSAEYKMWGNGLALPNVCFVFEGIVKISDDYAK